jgi:integrase
VAQGKGVFKRGNVWWLTYVDATGRMVRKTSGTSDYKAALKKLADCRDKVAKGKEVSKPNVRNVLFAEAVEEYLKWAKPQGAYKNKEYMAGDLEARFGNIPLRRFNVSMLEAFQLELIVQGKGPGTINRKMAMLKHLVHKCSDWGWVDDDTLRTVRKVKMLKEPAGRLRYLAPEEVQRLLKECTNPLLRAIVSVAVNSGMRRGEILNLTWDNVDLRNGYLLVTQSKNGDRREVPINVADLRHTAASFMAMGGIDLLSIKQILGHKTIKMTLRYSHLSPGHLRNAVAAIDRALTLLSDPTSQFTSQLTESSLPAGTSAGVTARF